jgi:hypothetical protein
MGFAKNQIAENIITDDIASTAKHHLKEAILTKKAEGRGQRAEGKKY